MIRKQLNIQDTMALSSYAHRVISTTDQKN
jgi:hypothetical protein